MLAFIDRLSTFFGRVSAWLFFAIAGVIVFEVVARYVFLSPTIWGEEMSRFLQIWATYLAAAYVLAQRKLIAIDLVVKKLPPLIQRAAEAMALLVMAVFCLVTCWYGTAVMIDSIRVGRATSTMLSVPYWMTEAAIPVGFGLLLLQILAELYRTLSRVSEKNAHTSSSA
ncbi:MAG: small integral membrane transport protein [Desulfobulbus propionicus]|nr:MAG: small integral membrane transport protein [Desulfobulbus propionicus]